MGEELKGIHDVKGLTGEGKGKSARKRRYGTRMPAYASSSTE